MIQLTPEQIQELSQEHPPKIVVDDKEYVLIQADAYERLRPFLELEEMQGYPNSASIHVANAPEYPATGAVEECDHVLIACVLN